jgi:hypothetical protein
VTLLSCSFCLDGTENLLSDGTRAGALTLALVAPLVVSGFVRFAWRVAKAERIP